MASVSYTGEIIWMVWLLTCCCAPSLNWRVICCTVARLSAVTLQFSHRWPRWSTLCWQLQLNLTGIDILKVHPWHSANPLARTAQLPRWSDSFVDILQFARVQMHLLMHICRTHNASTDTVSRTPYIVWSLLMSCSFRSHGRLQRHIYITPPVSNSPFSVQRFE